MYYKDKLHSRDVSSMSDLGPDTIFQFGAHLGTYGNDALREYEHRTHWWAWPNLCVCTTAKETFSISIKFFASSKMSEARWSYSWRSGGLLRIERMCILYCYNKRQSSIVEKIQIPVQKSTHAIFFNKIGPKTSMHVHRPNLHSNE